MPGIAGVPADVSRPQPDPRPGVLAGGGALVAGPGPKNAATSASNADRNNCAPSRVRVHLVRTIPSPGAVRIWSLKNSANLARIKALAFVNETIERVVCGYRLRGESLCNSLHRSTQIVYQSSSQIVFDKWTLLQYPWARRFGI